MAGNTHPAFRLVAPEPGAARVWNQKQLTFPLPNIDAIASIFGNELLGIIDHLGGQTPD
jgi:hypothetical protein